MKGSFWNLYVGTPSGPPPLSTLSYALQVLTGQTTGQVDPSEPRAQEREGRKGRL
jgi:hypothetical protein